TARAPGLDRRQVGADRVQLAFEVADPLPPADPLQLQAPALGLATSLGTFRLSQRAPRLLRRLHRGLRNRFERWKAVRGPFLSRPGGGELGERLLEPGPAGSGRPDGRGGVV